MRYFLAIDAGGTKTDCMLADEERPLARALVGSIKRMRVGEDEALGNLRAGLEALSRESGVGLRSIHATCVGTSGASVPLVADFIREAVGSLVGGKLHLCGDEEIALDAAFQGGPGVVVIAGTGSHVAGRTADGRLARSGGWGPAVSDEGSGHWIGQQAVRAVFQALNERMPTELTEGVLRQWGLGSVGELVGHANAAPDFAALAPVVVSCAEAGDAVALSVLRRGGEELARLAIHVIEHLREMEAGADGSMIEVAFTGSVLQQIAFVREAMFDCVEAVAPRVGIRREAVDSIDGALWRARSM